MIVVDQTEHPARDVVGFARADRTHARDRGRFPVVT